MDPVIGSAIVGGVVEGARMALQLYLLLLSQSGMTAEQQAAFEKTEREEFLLNRPGLLPKPPKEE